MEPQPALLWSGDLHHLVPVAEQRCHQPLLSTRRLRQLRRIAQSRRTGSHSSSAYSTDSLIDRQPLSTIRAMRRTRGNQKGSAAKGRVEARAESQRSDSSVDATVRYGAIRTSTVGGLARLRHPAERHDDTMLDFSAVSTLRPQRNFTATQPTR